MTDHVHGPDEDDNASVQAAAGRFSRPRDLPQPKRLSEILEEVAVDETRDRISVGDLLQAMDGRAFGALLLIFAFPNMLPTPPGTAGILGMPLLFLSVQMMLGQSPWLPGFIAKRSMTRDALQQIVSRATPWLARAEKLLKQRLTLLVHPMAERALGALCLLVAVVLMLPIPFGNMLPSFAICVIALGVLERDGLWIVGGVILSAVAVGIVGAMGYAVVKSAMFLLLNAF